MMFTTVFLSAAALFSGVEGHGRLAVPKTRLHTISGYDAYENDPVNFGTSQAATTYHKFACRNDPPMKDGALMAPQTTVTAGGMFDVRWNLGVKHVGDCAMYASYDYDATGEAGRSAMKWFKIANWKDCQRLDGESHQIKLPSWMPAGRAVLRWDWYALHVFPTIEFYAQCADVQIIGGASSLSSPNDVPSYSVMGLYPESANNAPGWRQELGLSVPETWMTGPPCACRDSQENGCEYTASADETPGFISKDTLTNVAGCGAAAGTPTPTTAVPPTPKPTAISGPPTSPVPEPTPSPTSPVTGPPSSPVAAPTQGPEECANAYDQCGGFGWAGASCCKNDYVCTVESFWYSNCRPAGNGGAPTAQPIEAPASSPVEAPTYAPAPVEAPTSAPAPPTSAPAPTTECTNPEAAWAKCGGTEYSGSGCCVDGYYCKFQDAWYSQCVPNGRRRLTSA